MSMADRTMEELLQAPTEGACPHHGFSELTQIDTFYNGLTEQDQDSLNVASGGNLLNKKTREALQIIENKSKVCYSRRKSNVSRVNTNSRDVVSKTDDRIDKLADQISNLVEIVNKQVIDPTKAVEKICVTCGGAHAYYECIATDSNPSSVCVAIGSYNQVSLPNRASHQIPPPGFAPVQNNPNRFNQGQGNYFNQANNSIREIISIGETIFRIIKNKPLTSGTLPSNTIPNPKGEMKAVTTRSGLAYEGPSIPTESPLEKVDEQSTDKEHSNSSGSTTQVQPLVVPISIPKPDVLRTRSKPTIPYPSRLNDQKLREKATNQMEKFFQIFHDLHFDISFADALLLMPKFASTIKSLLANKDKHFELANVPLNENCSAMLLKKLPKKLGDPGKFLIPCNFPGMEVCHALADLGASINLMPLPIWKKLSLPKLTPTWMTLEVEDRSITRPKGVAEDVFVKVGKFHFPTDFVVVDFKANPRVPLILGRSFLRTSRALIDVYGEEITLRVNDKSVTFNLDHVTRYSDNSSDFYEEPIVKTSPFGESDFFSEEIENFLKDDSIQIENSVFDPEGDILLIEKLLNEDPCQLPPMNLNQEKSPIEEPEYSFSIGYEHFITTPVMKLDEVAEFSAKNLVPIQSEYEVTSDNEKSHFLNVESNFVESLSNHATLKFDHLEEFFGALMPIRIAKEERTRREHTEYINLMERSITINPCPRPMMNANMIVESLPSSLIPIQDNDSQREEIDISTNTDELLPPGFENDDLEGEINVDNSIPNSENVLSKNEASDHDNLLFPRPPLEPPDDEFDFELNSEEEISIVMNNKDELECFDPGGEFDISTDVKDDDYFPFTFVIRIFMPYLTYPEVFPLLLSAESEDTIFDPGISV
nr:reverse transcriptase domain-containing protein [Tanacetum cinerariifolium]